jgi:hypothetical protein
MSSWIPGSDIAADLGLHDFEFAQEYVAKGLIPHNLQGLPYMPADVVFQIIAELGEELAQHEELAWNLTGYEREEIIANRIQPLQERIQAYRAYLESLNGSSWEGFEFPQDPELSARFIGALLNSFYLRDEVYNRLSPQPALALEQEPAQPAQLFEQVEKAVKQRKLRPEQRHRLACRAVAKKFCLENPDMRSYEMVLENEIAHACEGKTYAEETIRRWVKDIFQNRKPGKPKKKPS